MKPAAVAAMAALDCNQPRPMIRHISRRSGIAPLLAIAALGQAGGCRPAATNEVVVYVALDREFSEPILDEFAAQSGIVVLPKYDVESTKTVGLANAILREASRPRCDVFWNNEILNTLRLEEAGLLDVYRPRQWDQYPEAFRSPDGTWHGFAARARVLLVNRDLVAQDMYPRSIHDLVAETWRGRCGMAKPLFGTTATHAACLFAVWGSDEARAFFRLLKANEVRILGGNRQVAASVGAGELAIGLTDTDDAMAEIEQGRPVAIVYPDRQPAELGTLFLPNTLSILKSCPHPEVARKLVDYLLTAAIEDQLAAGASAQIPLNAQSTAAVRVETPRTVKAMQVNFAEAARLWDEAAAFLRDEFSGK